MEQQVSFQYQTTVKDMYRFLMHHAYIGVSGIINVVISGGALALLIANADQYSAFNKAGLILIASLFTIINPIYLYFKAAKQVKLTPMFQKPLDYLIDAKGIQVSQGEDQMVLPWEEVHKIIETKKDFYLYMSLTRAHVLPKEGYIEHVDLLRDIIKENATGAIKRLKKSEVKR